MILLRPAVAATAAAIGMSVQMMEFPPTAPIPPFPTTVLMSSAANQQQTYPITDVIKVFGRLAGDECYGKKAPPGSSCQITSQDIGRIFRGDDDVLTEEQFTSTLQSTPFQWPLKPFGLSESPSLAKTASMNKGAETKVYMDLLQQKQLYNPRDPTGPLPTSLRPKLNKLLQTERIEEATTKRVFEAFNDGKSTSLNVNDLRNRFSDHPMDYYEFLELMGKDSITWPY